MSRNTALAWREYDELASRSMVGNTLVVVNDTLEVGKSLLVAEILRTDETLVGDKAVVVDCKQGNKWELRVKVPLRVGVAVGN